MAELVQSPYPIFTDIDGNPLEDGYITIGIVGADPATSPLQAYWDEALTVPANNIRTKGGYPSNSGVPGRLYTATKFSIVVKNKRNVIVYTREDIYPSNINYEGDPIESGDILIQGDYDSLGNKSTQKKISWNNYESWKYPGSLKFPKSEAGIFGAYENLWTGPTIASGTVATVGEWEKLINGTGTKATSTVTLGTAQDDVSIQFFIKKGSTDVFEASLILAGTTNTFTFTFTTAALATTAGAFTTLTATEVVANQEYLITIIQSDTASGTDSLSLHASSLTTTGLYTYYKDVSYVGAIDYPVPYVVGEHTADSWIHPVNWNESTDWTIDMWFKSAETVPVDKWLFSVGLDAGYYVQARITTGNLIRLYTDDGSASGANTAAITPSDYTALKIVYTSGVSVAVYVNGVLLLTKTTNIPTNTDIAPILTLGSVSGLTGQLDGYITDVMIRPSADVTTTHYSGGLPWTNPENLIESQHGATLSEDGHLVVESIESRTEDAHTIVEQYTISDQTVTKWSNGDMEIIVNVTSSSVPITTASGALFISSLNAAVTYVEAFISIDSVIRTPHSSSPLGVFSAAVPTITDLPAYYFWKSVSATITTINSTNVSKGKWK